VPPAVTVVLPAHNEAEMLEDAVREVTAGLRERDRSFEIVVVENGSSDDTAVIANRLAGELPEVRALSLPEPDYGRALRAGLLAAVGDVVVNFDVDFCDLGFLDRAVPMVEPVDGPAVVVGSKRTLGSDDTRNWQRRMITNVFSTLLRVGFGLSVSDTHGVKAMRRAAVAPLARYCRNGGDLFDTELILRAERSGLRSAEIPVEVVEKRPARSSIRARIPRTVKGLVALRMALWRERLPGGKPAVM
jgi:glycosyltransferase involved in cell wall biosynthesis